MHRDVGALLISFSGQGHLNTANFDFALQKLGLILLLTHCDSKLIFGLIGCIEGVLEGDELLSFLWLLRDSWIFRDNLDDDRCQVRPNLPVQLKALLQLFEFLEVLDLVFDVENLLDSLLIGVCLADEDAHEFVIQFSHVAFMTFSVLA